MYGKSRGAKGFTSRRTGGVFNANFNRALRKVGNKYVSKKGKGGTGIRFATVGYARDVEKKYCDRTFRGVNITGSPVAITWTSGGVETQQGLKMPVQYILFNQGVNPGSGTNLVTGIGTGTTISTRIGNKITVKSIEIGLTLEAAKSPAPMNGEIENLESPVDPTREYMKTAYRIVVVKDKQVNNSTNNVTWNDVFGNGDWGLGSIDFGGSDLIAVRNMGRFEVLKDLRVQLDGDDPMKQINIKQWVNKTVRFNAGDSNALSDCGYYCLVCQDVLGTATYGTRVIMGNSRMTIRTSYTDV